MSRDLKWCESRDKMSIKTGGSSLPLQILFYLSRFTGQSNIKPKTIESCHVTDYARFPRFAKLASCFSSFLNLLHSFVCC